MHANMQAFCFQTEDKKVKYFNKKPTLYTQMASYNYN